MKVKANYGIGCDKGFFVTGETFDIEEKDLSMYGDAVTVVDDPEPAKEPDQNSPEEPDETTTPMDPGDGFPEDAEEHPEGKNDEPEDAEEHPDGKSDEPEHSDAKEEPKPRTATRSRKRIAAE